MQVTVLKTIGIQESCCAMLDKKEVSSAEDWRKNVIVNINRVPEICDLSILIS